MNEKKEEFAVISMEIGFLSNYSNSDLFRAWKEEQIMNKNTKLDHIKIVWHHMNYD